MSMTERCEMLEACGFFRNFKGNSEVVQNGWIYMFCDNLEHSKTCKRKLYKMEHGTPPPDNMTPLGKFLEEK
jgi:hypothetical protein